MASRVGRRVCSATIVVWLWAHPDGFCIRATAAGSPSSADQPEVSAPVTPELVAPEPPTPLLNPPSPSPSPPAARGNRGLFVGGVILAVLGIGLIIPGVVVVQKPENQLPEAAVQRNLVGIPLQIAGGISLGVGGLAILLGAPGVRD